MFGTDDVEIGDRHVIIAGRSYPVVDDVIVLLNPGKYPPTLRERLGIRAGTSPRGDFAEDIQFTFGEEWKNFSKVQPYHECEFRQHFHLVDLNALSGAGLIWDAGSVAGAIFWHRTAASSCWWTSPTRFSSRGKTLRDCAHALSFMADIKELSFRRDFADLVVCLGVLHHLPTDALDEVRALGRLAPKLSNLSVLCA